jgi:hypothetical protein
LWFVFRPLDLSEAPSPSTEIPQLGYGGTHANGLPLSGQQGSIGAPMLPPTSNMGSVIQGSPGLPLAGGLPSPSNQLNTPTRYCYKYYYYYYYYLRVILQVVKALMGDLELK